MVIDDGNGKQSTTARVSVSPWVHATTPTGKKTTRLEISIRQKSNTGNIAKRSLTLSVLEFKLDELRKELSSIHGGIFPHSVLSTQQISLLSTQQPTSIEQLEKIIGKLKTEKYGSKILEQIRKYIECKQPDGDLVNEEGSEIRSKKRLKTKKALVLVESSEDDKY